MHIAPPCGRRSCDSTFISVVEFGLTSWRRSRSGLSSGSSSSCRSVVGRARNAAFHDTIRTGCILSQLIALGLSQRAAETISVSGWIIDGAPHVTVARRQRP